LYSYNSYSSRKIAAADVFNGERLLETAKHFVMSIVNSTLAAFTFTSTMCLPGLVIIGLWLALTHEANQTYYAYACFHCPPPTSAPERNNNNNTKVAAKLYELAGIKSFKLKREKARVVD
jgi:hypothetical protein